ncbi:hypothetical protein ACHAXT_004297 [Thalassiosira profunda]
MRRPCLAIPALFLVPTAAFAPQPNWHRRQIRPLQSTSPQQTSADEDDGELTVVGVVAPLKYVGPYACLNLVFPHLASENGGDVSIDFVLDTGANVNSIRADLAKELELPVAVKKEDLSVLGSAGAGGLIQAGYIVKLGDCHLGDMPEGQGDAIFMRNLTAAALDLGGAASVADGLLGAFFFLSFPAGVEFDWYGTDGDPPTMIFYYGESLPEDAKKNAFRVPLDESFFGVPSLTVNINGKDLRAIIDTGSPVSIINPDVAEELGLSGKQQSPFNEVRGQGIDSEVMTLSRAAGDVDISIGGELLGDIGETCCIGTLPGLEMASDLSSISCPQVLLGLDAMRKTYRMILRLPANEVWFEKLPETK